MQVIPFIGAAGTILEGISTLTGIGYQQSVLAQQQKVDQANYERTIAAGLSDAREGDQEALALMDREQRVFAASGFALGSPAYVRRAAANRINATVNRGRIVEDANLQAESTRNRMIGRNMESKGLRRSAMFTVLGTAIGTGTSLLEGASLTSRTNSLNNALEQGSIV